VWAWTVAIASVGCGWVLDLEDPVVDVPRDMEVQAFPAALERKLDLLFVIDNSGLMGEEQISLAEGFPRLVDVLGSIDGGHPDLHIGVVSSDVGAGNYDCGDGNGDAGKFLTHGTTDQACAGLGPEPYLVDARNGPQQQKNYTGDLAAAFSCMATIGDEGCGYEQHLEAMRLGLMANRDFVRDDAVLAVIILADEDDCSAEPELFDTMNDGPRSPLGPASSFRCFEFGIACAEDGSIEKERAHGPRTMCTPDVSSRYVRRLDRYVELLKQLKYKDPSKIVVASIIGDTDKVVVGPDPVPENANAPSLLSSCNSMNGGADPGIRLRAFAESFPGRNAVASICNKDLSGPLTGIGKVIKTAMGDRCIRGAFDPACRLVDVTGAGTMDEQETPIATCAATGGVAPCWTVTGDATHCPDTASHLSIQVDRGGTTPLPGTRVRLRCPMP